MTKLEIPIAWNEHSELGRIPKKGDAAQMTAMNERVLVSIPGEMQFASADQANGLTS